MCCSNNFVTVDGEFDSASDAYNTAVGNHGEDHNGVGKKQAKAAGTIQARFNEVRKYRQESAAASLIQGKLANKLQVSASHLFEMCLLCVEGFRNVCVLVFVCLN